ncbi:DUF899 domain-containing protein [Spongiactinospora sp. TRM90649]|uniref:DUF899 domain-containing protein n=1 Tax=Spongiactinospora sp. TRM90649 TaxID=3031114 RepID=UPI0023F94318|nr:DUF899 domain-containing protein [Spongiactinospora sp. TRM90649]MDF5753647.1 DUF899 domain-containing protein [Spongiactinospora sp. TRM90649]
MNRPKVVSREEWQTARDALLLKEKEHTRALDALAAERRRLPMVRLERDYALTAPDGEPTGLAELFDGHRQVVIYHFMLSPGQRSICSGCASFADNIPKHSQPHLSDRGTRMILVSRAPQEDIEVVRRRMGWTVPWYSCHGTTFADDLGNTGGFGLSVLLNDGDEFFQTYYTTGRGVDRLHFDFNVLDLTPYGRQEKWEDSPEGWPQDPTMGWIRLRDEY